MTVTPYQQRWVSEDCMRDVTHPSSLPKAAKKEEVMVVPSGGDCPPTQAAKKDVEENIANQDQQIYDLFEDKNRRKQYNQLSDAIREANFRVGKSILDTEASFKSGKYTIPIGSGHEEIQVARAPKIIVRRLVEYLDDQHSAETLSLEIAKEMTKQRLDAQRLLDKHSKPFGFAPGAILTLNLRILKVRDDDSHINLKKAEDVAKLKMTVHEMGGSPNLEEDLKEALSCLDVFVHENLPLT
eukprot:CAMPEP_0184645518 /NCGR_PEP_ID=MMETSP0308-20130426/2014_1 /TAXON_ID=38269 /ORGANISM="Gloeochaete witrockiana, Strain SAG 46.84" /LENGTH=240 /DNA_ID=CAMNT_0027074635 /DNA_START=89 /DNA_END=811 /DNA_ORIENTATION=-